MVAILKFKMAAIILAESHVSRNILKSSNCVNHTLNDFHLILQSIDGTGFVFA